MARPIDRFDGEHAFLSNFHESPIQVEGLWFNTVEHAFQAEKTLDPKEKAVIMIALTPGKAKRLGRRATLRPDWEQVKLQVMEDLLRLKFAPGTELHQRLLATSPAELIEGNHWNDRFWGVCKGTGQNHLGKLLMKIRDEGAC